MASDGSWPSTVGQRQQTKDSKALHSSRSLTNVNYVLLSGHRSRRRSVETDPDLPSARCSDMRGVYAPIAVAQSLGFVPIDEPKWHIYINSH